MFEALDPDTNMLVYAKHAEYDKIYRCPNTFCQAELKIRSLTGAKRQHFYNFPKAKKHIDHCPYARLKGLKRIKLKDYNFDIANIYLNAIHKVTGQIYISKNSKNKLPSKNYNKYIHTVQQLFYYYLYVESKPQTTNDMFISNTNFHNFEDNKGFWGIKLVFGNTIYYRENYILVRIYNLNKSKFYNCYIYFKNLMDRNKVNNIILSARYSTKTYKDKPIVILGNWNKVEKYTMHTTCFSLKQIYLP